VDCWLCHGTKRFALQLRFAVTKNSAHGEASAQIGTLRPTAAWRCPPCPRWRRWRATPSRIPWWRRTRAGPPTTSWRWMWWAQARSAASEVDPLDRAAWTRGPA